MKPVLALTLALLGGPALAQSPEEDARANALILPMLQEMVPGYQGQVLAACVVTHADPAEKSLLASAPAPSAEIGAIVTAVLARPATIGCVEATLGQ